MVTMVVPVSKREEIKETPNNMVEVVKKDMTNRKLTNMSVDGIEKTHAASLN